MQRNHLILLSFIMLINLSAHSQRLDKLLHVKYKEGFAILANGDTIDGNFEFNDCEQNYKLLVYINPVSLTKKAYTPEEVTYFALDSLFYLPKKFKDGWEFVQLISNDSMKVYIHKHFFTTDIRSEKENQIMYEKPGGEYLLVSSSSFFPFKTKVGDFFSDDTELLKKINNNVYTKDDFMKIAYEYNIWLKKKKK